MGGGGGLGDHVNGMGFLGEGRRGERNVEWMRFVWGWNWGVWLREHGRVYSAGSPVDTGEIALYKNYSLLLLHSCFTLGTYIRLFQHISVHNTKCNEPSETRGFENESMNVSFFWTSLYGLYSGFGSVYHLNVSVLTTLLVSTGSQRSTAARSRVKSEAWPTVLPSLRWTSLQRAATLRSQTPLWNSTSMSMKKKGKKRTSSRPRRLWSTRPA